MYNESLKNRFLNIYSDDTAKIYKYSLLQISESEEFYKKDIFDFNYDQLDNAFKSIRSKTMSGVRRNVSPILEYIRWANKNGFVKSKIDITNLFMGDKLKDYVWKHAHINSYIYREEMYVICEQLINPIDRAIIVLAFEGIDGKGHFEMINLKYSDIDFQTGKVHVANEKGDIREIVITYKKSLDILKEAQKQNTYLIGNGEANRSKRTEFELTDTPYIIRKINRPNTSKNNELVSSGFIASKATKFFKGKRDVVTGEFVEIPFVGDCEFLNLQNIFKSGYFDYCMNLENEKGELKTQDYKDICIRFGINPNNIQSYKAQYLDWKKILSERD
ncbi:phage lytic cycle repressor MrpR family protein [Anaerovorax odorimutans]|uniref:phage lytic cycle repressor MrpR family protein n=1 Tax=Anaerovorax odorimutans TaxID=109327 RepID=UPI0003FDE725|nr:hypothetical protein [Anaerovorax odorimutans]